MRLQLLDVKVSKEMSRETTAFHALVAIDGRVVGYAANDGGGGSTVLSPHAANAAAIKESRDAMALFATKAHVVTGWTPDTMTQILDLLVSVASEARSVAKFFKKFSTAKPGGTLYRDAAWRDVSVVHGDMKPALGYVPCTVDEWRNPSIDLDAADVGAQLKAMGFQFDPKTPGFVVPEAPATSESHGLKVGDRVRGDWNWYGTVFSLKHDGTLLVKWEQTGDTTVESPTSVEVVTGPRKLTRSEAWQRVRALIADLRDKGGNDDDADAIDSLLTDPPAADARPGDADLALMEESAEFLMTSGDADDSRRGKAILAAVAFLRAGGK